MNCLPKSNKSKLFMYSTDICYCSHKLRQN